MSECPAGGAPGPPEGEFHPPAPCDPAVAAGYTAATPLVVTSIGTTLLALIILGLRYGGGGRRKRGGGAPPKTVPRPPATPPAAAAAAAQGYMTKQNLFRSAAFMFLIGGVSAISAWEEGAQPVGHP